MLLFYLSETIYKVFSRAASAMSENKIHQNYYHRVMENFVLLNVFFSLFMGRNKNKRY